MKPFLGRFMLIAFAAPFALVIAVVRTTPGAQWIITPRGSLAIELTEPGSIEGLSGIALTNTDAGTAQLLAIQDRQGRAISVEARIQSDGTVDSPLARTGQQLSEVSDYEGVAYLGASRDSVYVADEAATKIREFDFRSGAELRIHDLPTPFHFTRANRGLESLTQSVDGNSLWTANEEALSVDGSLATETTGTTVRLVELIRADTHQLSLGRQFAYRVEPLHGVHEPILGTRSGLVDLAAVPGGGMLALERSLALEATTGLPTYESRIYEVQFAGATDVSGPEFEQGLAGGNYLPVEKELLWSGRVGGGLGQNLEGLTLGPRLSGGSWSLVGVVDDGDLLSGDTLVSFELRVANDTRLGDFNGNGQVEQGDLDLVLLHWGSAGSNPPGGWIGIPPIGLVDQQELDAVLLHWGSLGGASSLPGSVPEPQSLLLLMASFGLTLIFPTRRVCST